MKGHLEIFASLAALQQGAAEKIVMCLGEAILAHGSASFVLSGGATPRGVYELLGSEKYRNQIEWRRSICSGETSAVSDPQCRKAIFGWQMHLSSGTFPYLPRMFTAFAAS